MDKRPSIAICVPTYEREEIIKKFVEINSKVIDDSADILIFDSGVKPLDADSIVKVAGNINIEILRMPSELSANAKFYEIYKKMQDSDYDYIWMIHDHTVFDREAYLYIKSCLISGADFYAINMQGARFFAYDYNNIGEFCINTAWMLNSVGSAIVNREGFLISVDWSGVGRFLERDSLPYSHVGLYFDTLAGIDSPQIVIIECIRDCFCDFLRNERPSWYRDTIRNCSEGWGSMMGKLPLQYKDITKTAVKTQDQFFLSKYNIFRLKKDGLYGIRDYIRYRKWINMVRTRSGIDLAILAFTPDIVARQILFLEVRRLSKRYRKHNYSICLYGAGRHAVEYCEIFTDMGVSIDAYLVTSLKGNDRLSLNRPIFQANEFLKDHKAFVIIAVQTSHVKEIEDNLYELKKSGLKVEYISL